MTEIEVLKDVVRRLDKIDIEYMISGSIAMNFYATPRMTRDIDIVVVIEKSDIDKIFSEFKNDYYVDDEMIRDAFDNNSMFNIIHTKEIVKIDFIIRKNNEYRLLEFSKKRKIKLDETDIYVVSIEDLIISKLYWAKDSFSSIQIRDIKNLLNCKVNRIYLKEWIEKLELKEIYSEVIK
ncbi:MAG: hypothetical protein KA885_02150 [Spirochaetes bacterium]|nr:hypothetical protein [Spirochaetota bacterium]